MSESSDNIEERKVLKVDTKEPEIDTQQIQAPLQDTGDENIPDDNAMEFNNDEENLEQPEDNNNPFDSNFDAGVEADEESDPKRYIQQLTGKLSQSLRSYNSELPTPDADLNKYVAGMINKQAVDGLNDEDVKEILSKIKGDDKEEPDDDFSQNESVKREKINEIFNEIIGSDSNDDEQYKQEKPIQNVSYKKMPFTAPKL